MRERLHKGLCDHAADPFGSIGDGVGIGWSVISKEHQEAASLPLNSVDFNALSDGTVTDGKVTNIQLMSTIDPVAENMDYETLNNRGVQAQSLQVDTISSATLTSKAYLKAVENALIQA